MNRLAKQSALPLLLLLTLSACSDRTDHYNDVIDARTKHVFEKGWLPDILPTSTRDLRVTTTVEISAGRGAFHFDPKDYNSFSAKLAIFDGGMSKVEKDNKTIKRLMEKGYEAHTYSAGATHWIFLCEKKIAVCEFFVWQ